MYEVDPSTDTSQANLPNLFETVVKGGYCIGCGICSVLPGSPISIQQDDLGRYQAVVDDAALQSTEFPLVVPCPFSDDVPNESELGLRLFGDHAQYDERIGYFLGTYAGHVAEGAFRENGSSGGLGTWIIAELLTKGLVDGVLHVRETEPGDSNGMLFQYDVSTTLEELCSGAKSRYYPVEMSRVLEIVANSPGKRFALVGIPCFIKAARLLCLREPVFAERIPYFVGLVCGHLKSKAFAESFAWQFGVEPGHLQAINFRKKLSDRPANDYGVQVIGQVDGEVITATKPTRDLFGSNWGHGMFKYQACDYCDDILAETADVVVGDAWLPAYNKDSNGTNIMAVRHPIVHELIVDAAKGGRLSLTALAVDDIAKSQDANYRHRREGLAYRLFMKDKEGVWRPKKRVAPSVSNISRKRRNIFKHRQLIAERSHVAFSEAVRRKNYRYFRDEMEPLIARYERIYEGHFRVTLNIVKKLLRFLIRG